ncbi:hypothetical protein EC991_005800 [Linnemannia zychae]|nr:hypothetical protein EC991_005800 [Linnemannia zychae]
MEKPADVYVMTDAITSERAASREPSVSLKEKKGDEAHSSEGVNQPNTVETTLATNENDRNATEDKTGGDSGTKKHDKPEETSEDKGSSSANAAKRQKADGSDDDEEGDEDEEDRESEYEVEMVVGHKHVKGKLHYHIKWNGYSSDDNSWEDQDNVFCTDLIEAYWKRHEEAGGSRSDLKGIPKKDLGRPIKANGTATAKKSLKNRSGYATVEMAPAKRQKTSSAPKDAPKVAPKDVRKSDDVGMNVDLSGSKWTPPKNWASWENKVETIQTVERINQQLLIRLAWKGGKETQHPIEEAHQKCPQKLIQFYESHIKFSQA